MLVSKPTVLPRMTVTDAAVIHLREEIVAGRLPSGELLPEAKVGLLLGVSRAPVREALVLLEREGLIKFDRRGTAQVCTFTHEDLREIALMRGALEPVAARLVCERRSDRVEREFQDNLRALRRSKSLSDVTRLDVEFHRLVMRHAGHRRLLAAWEALASQFLFVLMRCHGAIEGQRGQTQDRTYHAHTELFNAIKSGDGARAEALARQHVNGWLVEFEQLEVFPAMKEAAL